MNDIPNILFREKMVKVPYLVYNKHFCSYNKGKTLESAKIQVWPLPSGSLQTTLKSISYLRVKGRMALVGLMDAWIDRREREKGRQGGRGKCVFLLKYPTYHFDSLHPLLNPSTILM